MKRLKFRTTQRSRRANRAGTVQMELAMFLPLYATLLMVLFTICSFARTRHNVVITARHQAWMKQAQFGDETEPLNGAGIEGEQINLILHGSQNPASGLISGNQEQNAKSYLKTLKVLTQSKSDHYVFTDPWDHRVLGFEDKNKHPRLTMDDRISVFGSLDLNSFSALASASAASPETASQRLQALQKSREQATAAANKALAKMRKEVQEQEQEISQLQQQLDDARSQTPPDVSAIDSLNEQLRTSNHELQKLKNRLHQLETMSDNLNSLL